MGLITKADQAEAILNEGRADLIVMAKELLRNPYFPLHARTYTYKSFINGTGKAIERDVVQVTNTTQDILGIWVDNDACYEGAVVRYYGGNAGFW